MTAPRLTSSGRTRRLYVDAALGAGATIVLEGGQAHYALNVVRLKAGDEVAVFNGRDGEWRARFVGAKRAASLEIETRVRPQSAPSDLHYLFAPLKHARLDYLVQKATEMGAGRLRPVMTERTVAARVNLDRMRANAIEAAEQCGLVWVPDVDEPAAFDALLGAWPAGRALVFADEAAAQQNPVAALQALRGQPVSVIVGPEGGFAPRERARLLDLPAVCPVWLGPRVMRADTAAVAVLALVQALAGDWSVSAK